MFRTQICASCACVCAWTIAHHVPAMVALLTESAVKAVYEEEKRELQAEGVAVADNIQVGIMIEIWPLPC